MCLTISVNNILSTKLSFWYRKRDCFVVYKGFYISIETSGESNKLLPGVLTWDQWSKEPYTVTRLYGKTYFLTSDLAGQYVDLYAVNKLNYNFRSIHLKLPKLGMHTYAVPFFTVPQIRQGDIYGHYMVPMLVDYKDIQLFGEEDTVVVKRGIFPPWDELKPFVEQDLRNLCEWNESNALKILDEFDPDLEKTGKNYEAVHSVLEDMWKRRK